MNEPEDVIQRLTRHLDRVAALREAAINDPKLDAARQRLRAWQAVRLARTHADLLTNPRMGLAAAFFLTDVYGAEDLSKLDANVRRVVPTMKRVLPAAGLEIVAEAIELEALSEDLDFAMATALGAKANKLSAATYGAAYRKIDCRAERERQIDLIENLGQSLDRLVHKPFVGTTLSLMHKPAQLAGLGELQDFLQRGYQAFIKMGDAHEFLNLVVGRERKLLEALFAGDDSLLGE
ncbi:MAG: FFLEELY motif protein [Roseiarcus sp.]